MFFIQASGAAFLREGRSERQKGYNVTMPSLSAHQVSSQEIAERIKKVREKMEKAGFSAYISFSPDNVYYLTNFANFVHERPFVLVITPTDVTFIIPRLERAHVERHKVGDELKLVEYAEFPAMAGTRWSDRLQDVLPAQGTIGIEGACPAYLSASVSNPTQVLNVIDAVREIKSPHEISRIAWTSDVMTNALGMMLGAVKNGTMVAQTIAGVTPYFYQRCLTEAPNYNVMSTHAAGLIQPPAYTDDPHNFSCLTAPCEPGGPFLGLVAGKINGYGAEIERTFFLEHVPEDARKPFDTMMEMRHKAYSMLKPGAVGSEIDAACLEIAKKAGYDTPLHRTGHSFGVTSHEAPFLAIGEDNMIEPGMLFSIEPGIYMRGQAGFRHSDTVLVTETGYEILTKYPDEKEDLTLS
ncbi:M24 family metallopeptidase [Acetobacter cerevisiae]|uniref:M24 family metallopeptidase n=1 Tax=Acetobacter cerevisiae TaxID=178900 RepID=UPI00209E1421|nr:Xaa-Pro peptidase family protein [Acetobacter cerevisiae]MCP1270858.1 Xaa-Pro peptidase family protein [Acetobacter cerevisiae]MCP1278809.1 Xaa-Pro peptidase family protein [Acetobacter cerevisiae]